MKKLVAVFGSLRTGFGNNRVLGDSKSLGFFQSPPAFNMLDAGGFPYLVKKENGDSIKMEVFEVTREDIARGVDRLEGHYSVGNPNNFYDKGEIETPWGVAEYYFNHDGRGLKRVASGDWEKR